MEGGGSVSRRMHSRIPLGWASKEERPEKRIYALRSTELRDTDSVALKENELDGQRCR